MATYLRSTPATITEWDDTCHQVTIHVIEEVIVLLGPPSKWENGCGAKARTELADIEYSDGLVHRVGRHHLKELAPKYG